jgi:hypothetical protein
MRDPNRAMTEAACVLKPAPAVQAVLEEISQAVPLGDRGKGSAVWTASDPRHHDSLLLAKFARSGGGEIQRAQ